MTATSNPVSLLSAALFGATLLGAAVLPTTVAAAEGAQQGRAVIYFTRHAEKKTTTQVTGKATTIFETDLEQGNDGDDLVEKCGLSKCAEELNALGLLRAQMLADWFDQKGITDDVTHVYSSHKVRTRQTVAVIAERAGLTDPEFDYINDGVMQLPSTGTELNPQSTSSSVDLTVNAIYNLQNGDVAVIAGHSGTLYKIMDSLGIDTLDTGDFPRDEKGKVRDFGDIWKVVIKNGNATFKWRKNLQPSRLRVVETLPSPSPEDELLAQ